MGAYSSSTQREFYLSIAQDANPGYLDYSAFGINQDIDILTAPEDVWLNGGVFVPPTTYRIHNIASASANDTSAGTGAKTIKIFGVVSTGLAEAGTWVKARCTAVTNNNTLVQAALNLILKRNT